MAHSGRQRVSLVWDYFKQLTTSKVRCTLCNCELSFRGGSTSNLNRHVRLKHPFANSSEKSCRPLSNYEEDESSNDFLQDNSGEFVSFAELKMSILIFSIILTIQYSELFIHRQFRANFFHRLLRGIGMFCFVAYVTSSSV